MLCNIKKDGTKYRLYRPGEGVAFGVIYADVLQGDRIALDELEELTKSKTFVEIGQHLTNSDPRNFNGRS